jgi:hypothetical protein
MHTAIFTATPPFVKEFTCQPRKGGWLPNGVQERASGAATARTNGAPGECPGAPHRAWIARRYTFGLAAISTSGIGQQRWSP